MTAREIEAIVIAANRKDRAWFRAHPRRTVRVRALVPGEMDVVQPRGDGVAVVIVRQIGPGVRARVPAYLPAMPEDTEREAKRVLRLALDPAA